MNKQKAVEYWQLVYENNENYCDENWDADEKQAHQRWCEALKTVLDLLEEQREWIPISERLPSVFQKAVVCNIHGEMMIGEYTKFGWMFPCYFEKPIAWMPLPEPYGEEVGHE